MIVITKTEHGITVKGHANYAEPGKDIVCAAISTLAQTLIYSIEDLAESQIKYHISPGTVDIKYWDLSKDAQLLVNSFFIGCQMIADNYPDNVRVEK